MRDHNKHNVLGEYCWDCKKRTSAGIPGWPKASKDDGPINPEREITSVVWADGTEDVSRECVICKTIGCNIPVYDESYIEVANNAVES